MCVCCDVVGNPLALMVDKEAQNHGSMQSRHDQLLKKDDQLLKKYNQLHNKYEQVFKKYGQSLDNALLVSFASKSWIIRPTHKFRHVCHNVLCASHACQPSI